LHPTSVVNEYHRTSNSLARKYHHLVVKQGHSLAQMTPQNNWLIVTDIITVTPQHAGLYFHMLPSLPFSWTFHLTPIGPIIIDASITSHVG